MCQNRGMVPSGNYTFNYYGYGANHTPLLRFTNSAQFYDIKPLGETLTLSFETGTRYCTGWHNLATGESHPCPNTAELPLQYHECRHCQQKTGFNPAFYHAASVSPQQQARNQEPHFLYLAHFAPSIVKVGISHAKRDRRRLLDQGARSALILKTLPTAEAARKYEARIASLPGIAETIQGRLKQQLLNKAYDTEKAHQELLATRLKIEQATGLETEDIAPLSLDSHYLIEPLKSGQLIDLAREQKISGRIIGMVGGTLIAEQDGAHFILPLSKLRGYKATLSPIEEPNQHAPQQASLF
jgi:hypothetical protein